MLSVLEKIRFILSTRIGSRFGRKLRAKEKKEDKLFVRVLKKTVKVLVAVFIFLFALGLYISYFTAPMIVVDGSRDKAMFASESPYTIKGAINSGNKSELIINGENIDLVGSEFAHTVELQKGNNEFIFESSNKRGITRETYTINYQTH